MRVIDFSADYRLRRCRIVPRSGTARSMPTPSGWARSVYGLPELFREQIREAQLVANPGCYPTSAILPLAPLIKAGLIAPPRSSSTPRAAFRRGPHAEADDAFSRVQREHLGLQRRPASPHAGDRAGSSARRGQTVEVIFTPHLVPMDRGILSTTYSQPMGELSEEKALGTLSASSIPTSRSCASSIICPAPRTPSTRTFATSRRGSSAAG